jgi:uncharacterized membrane protein
MTLAPLVSAGPLVQIHAGTALIAVCLAAIQLSAPKAGVPHRAIGWAFTGAMAVTALSSFGIAGLRHGQFSPIHLLSVLTLAVLPVAIIARRQGNIRRHKWSMIGLASGLLVAGVFTLLPGRIMHRVVFTL